MSINQDQTDSIYGQDMHYETKIPEHRENSHLWERRNCEVSGPGPIYIF